METVYPETTVVGTIASRDNADPIIPARQPSTRRWWADAPSKFDLRVSDLVIAECQAGDPIAASERLHVIAGIPILAPNSAAEFYVLNRSRGFVRISNGSLSDRDSVNTDV